MQDNFDLKKFLVENKLTPASQMNEMGAEPMMLQVGDQITPDMLKNPSQFEFPMEIASFSNDGNEDTVRVKRMVKSKGMFGGRESEDTFEDLVSNWERIHLKPNVRMSAQTEMDFDTPLNEVTVKGKKVKTYKQNGDKSYSVEFEDGSKDTIAVSHNDWDKINDDSMNEYFSFDNKSPEGQRIKNKPQDVLNRRGQGQITPDNKDIYKKVVGKKGDVGKAYGNVGPKGSLPENGSAFSKY
jgi:hypothetical protein